ncbi:hypothetical protein LTR70_005031 [Exophiala xenobiotica]|uniref:Uncharacterized protein n=1 Tax=Lithohypha guttulata TaxID=1690604 RepID=A0ABR0JW42_9EURO|nr:hypothetical protein LTR24_010026 [Lithohypha guttulata]KAK5319278.1 hypothetical protein LTR70_005031 [Exophiala xenobiotica]
MSSRNLTSSPLSSARSSADIFQDASSQPQPQYRSAAPLPFELLQHVQVYLEENLFSQALRFLLSLISATTVNEKKGILVPPPEYLAVISTLTVHPSLTSRASTQDKLVQSNTALRLLWTISKNTGPVNSRLNEAFRFRRYDNRLSLRNGDAEENDDDWRNKLTITYADKDSLFNLADDFWAVVGWTLNCSCLSGPYNIRWNCWLPWLEYMLETLETDWGLREKTGSCDQSLLWQYIKGADGGNAKGRRVLRATFADGGASAFKEFRAIFPKELKERKQEKAELKKQEVRVDVDEEIYGDWMQESDSTTDEEASTQQIEPIGARPNKRLRTRTPSTRRRMTPRATRTLHTDHEDSEESMTENTTTDRGLGPPESMHIRLRLLQLLSNASAHHELITSSSGVNWPDPHELFTLFVEFVRPLPLPLFAQLVLPTKSVSDGLTAETRMALCEFLLQRVVDSEHTLRTSTFEPMTVERLMQNYLPYASGKNTVEFQSKVSVLLESVLRQLARDNSIGRDQRGDLLGVLDEGIEVRAAKARDVRGNSRYKKAANQGEELAAQVLEESGMRMKFVVEQLIR